MSAELVTIASFTLCATLLTITPGADTLLVLTQGLRSGRRAALACALGVNAGLVCWASLTVAGLAALLDTVPWAYRCIRIAGAVYLICLGTSGFVRGRGTNGAAPFSTNGSAAATAPMAAFRRGLITNLLNPKVGIFYISLLPQFAPPDHRGPALLSTLAAIHLLLSLVWLGALGCASARAARSLSKRTTRRLEGIGAVTLVGAGAAIVGASL
jgi:threonine/homoserine/homoserine lactone efflux protein